MTLIPNWRSAIHMLSVRIAAFASALMLLLVGFPDLWTQVPPEVRALLPRSAQAVVPLLLFLATIAGRLVKQPGVSGSTAPSSVAAPLMFFAGQPRGYDRARLVAELIRDEGERLKVYRCTVGKQTIGVGRNLDDVGISAQECRALGITTAACIAHGITQVQSRGLLDSDIDRCERDLDAQLPWWRQLDAVRQRVLLNMCFNMGIGSLLGFRNTLAAIRQGRYAAAVIGMQASRWHDQVGVRARRLEAMMATGR